MTVIDYQAIGVRIRRRRKALHMTQQKLAECSEIEPSNISHIERGATKLSLPTIVSIANALGVTVNDLICDSLNESSAIYEKMASEILADCNQEQQIIITETMLTLKKALFKME